MRTHSTRSICKQSHIAGAVCLLLCCSILFAAHSHAAESDYEDARMAMVADLEVYTARANAGGIEALSPELLEALAQVGRHEFIPAKQVPFAYENRPLPIGFGQTISQPYIVALMTELIRPKRSDVVLEVGTGSGYQAAVLAKLVARVFSIEIVEALARRVDERLPKLGYDNVTTKLGDGYYGWAEHGPFDAIVVTAAASHVPPPLVEQLKPGGRMVIPVGGRFQTQHLLLIEKTANGDIRTRQITAVRFVPLTGQH